MVTQLCFVNLEGHPYAQFHQPMAFGFRVDLVLKGHYYFSNSQEKKAILEIYIIIRAFLLLKSKTLVVSFGPRFVGLVGIGIFTKRRGVLPRMWFQRVRFRKKDEKGGTRKTA